MWEKTILFYCGFRTLGQPASRAERSGLRPTNPLAFSLNLLYSEMSSISINGLCFDPLLWYFVVDLLVKSCRKYIVGNRIGEKYMILDLRSFTLGTWFYDPWFWSLIYDPLLWVLDFGPWFWSLILVLNIGSFIQVLNIGPLCFYIIYYTSKKYYLHCPTWNVGGKG